MKFRHNLVLAFLLFYPLFHLLCKLLIFITTSVFLEEELSSFFSSARFEQITELIVGAFLFLTLIVSWFSAKIMHSLVSKYLDKIKKVDPISYITKFMKRKNC